MFRFRKRKSGLLITLMIVSWLSGCSFNADDPMRGLIDTVTEADILTQEQIDNVKAQITQIGEEVKTEFSELVEDSKDLLAESVAPIMPGISESVGKEENTGKAGTMEVHFIDVGQGDATLIIDTDDAGNKACMLIDAGGNDVGTKIQNYLRKRGVEHLDMLVISHADEDHEGSADLIITKFDIGTVLMSSTDKNTYAHRDVVDALEYKGISAQEPVVGTVYELADATATVIGPVGSYEDINNNSICLKIEKGDTSFLFCGDAEELAENELVGSGTDLSADVYHVNHHGSNTSSTEDFLKAVNPAYAVISVGENNDYWHPHGSTLNTIRKLGIMVYRTDEQGSIIATSDGNTITWNTPPSDTWQAGEGPK